MGQAARVSPSALFNKPTEHPMSQPFDASKSLATLEQDNTVIAVIEMSQSKWLVAAVILWGQSQPPKKTHAGKEGPLKSFKHLGHGKGTERGRANTVVACARS